MKPQMIYSAAATWGPFLTLILSSRRGAAASEARRHQPTRDFSFNHIDVETRQDPSERHEISQWSPRRLGPFLTLILTSRARRRQGEPDTATLLLRLSTTY